MSVKNPSVARELVSESAAPNALPAEDPGGRALAGLSFLVVDDIPDNQLLVAWIMESQGARVTCAGNGEEAIHLATEHGFDLVIMDMQMPVCSGFQATKALRAQGYQRPILAISAGALREEADRALAVGCNEFLVKPYSVPSLIHSVMGLVGR